MSGAKPKRNDAVNHCDGRQWDSSPSETSVPMDMLMARCLVGQMLDQTPGLLDAAMAGSIVVVVEVPGTDWSTAVAQAWDYRIATENLRIFGSTDGGATTAPESEEFPFETSHVWLKCIVEKDENPWWSEKRGLLDALAAGDSVLGIAPVPERYLPSELLRVADWRVALPPFTPDVLADAIGMAMGVRPATTLEPALCRLVGLADLELARRPRQTPEDYLARLRKIVAPKIPTRSVTLDDLHGMDEAIIWGRALATDLREYLQGRLAWSDVDRGVLLVGPPGTGKTTFARALASTCGVPLIVASLYRWQSMGHLGDLQKAMRKTFNEARSRAPVILMVDELDSFGDREQFAHDNKDYSVQVINGFLEELDGVLGREGVVLVGACNNVQRLDPAIRRSGRMDLTIDIPLPDQRALEKIFRHHLAGELADTDLTGIATLALGGTGADVERWARGARRRARTAGRPVMVEDLAEELRGGADRGAEALWLCAVHEAGHAVITAVLFPQALGLVTIRYTAETGGGTACQWDNPYPTRDELLGRVMVLLAGRAAEEVVLGKVSASSGGSADSDLAKATMLITSMVTAFGLDDSVGLLWLGIVTPGNVDLMLRMRPVVEQRVSAILAERYVACLELIRANRAGVERVADRLVERETLAADDVLLLVSGRGE